MSPNPPDPLPEAFPEALEAELIELARPFDEAIARLGEVIEVALPETLRHGLDELEALHFRRTAALVLRAHERGYERGRREAGPVNPGSQAGP